MVQLLVNVDNKQLSQLQTDEVIEILNHQKLNRDQTTLEDTIKKFSVKESNFLISKLEYEQKEDRFFRKTNYPNMKLDQEYIDKNLSFKDINDHNLLKAISDLSIFAINKAIEDMIQIIDHGVEMCYKRLRLIQKHWVSISEELLKKLNSFNYYGMKHISNNLRIKLLPELELLKLATKEELIEDSMSRVEINMEIESILNQAREDIFGDLSEEEIIFYDDLNSNLSQDQLIKILKDENSRKHIIELLKTNKISINIDKVIDRLI
ncbi:MAG: hypothetical protein OEY49_07965 [Candidatus Heimdallarchaeota archaeon]|nr:hypothetical protein [Candidatus Heimdallarchaeota archaeon]